MREHEADQAEHLGVLVHQVAELMSDNETELVICHEVDQGRIYIHNMRFTLACGCDCPCIHCRITCDVEINRVSETEFVLDTIKKVIKMAHEPLLNLEAMAFHSASEAVA